MINSQTSFYNISTIGFLTAWLGILLGFFLCFLSINSGKKFKGTVLGFLGGTMLAILCFDIIPESFEGNKQYSATIGILIGMAIAFILDGLLSHNHHNNKNNRDSHYNKVAAFFALGSSIHNIPSGIALGSLLAISHTKGMQLSMALLIHTIPEGLTIGMYLKEGSASLIKIIIFSLLISIPMGIGAFMGSFIGKISPNISALSLSFAAGLILYTICKEIIPESIYLWKGRLSAVSTALGLLVGKLLMSLIH